MRRLFRKADNFASRQVQFSRYQLVHLLGWREEGKSYSRLEESLKRWLGVTLHYENASWAKVQLSIGAARLVRRFLKPCFRRSFARLEPRGNPRVPLLRA